MEDPVDVQTSTDEIYPSYFAETRSPPFDIAKAISKLLNKRRSISRQDIAELPKLSWKLMKRILSQIFTVKKIQLMIHPPVADGCIEP
jgi:hypothetical protein